MIHNLIFDTNPIFVHAPGKLRFSPLWDEALKHEIVQQVNSEVLIITWNSGKANKFIVGKKNLGTFERSVKGADIFSLGMDVGGSWRNRMKFSLTKNFLEGRDEDIVIGGDSADVLLLGSLTNIVAKFKSKNCKLLYNAEKLFWPEDYRPDLQSFEASVASRYFPYLNAGLWVGYRTFVKDFFEEAIRISKQIKIHPNSEQVCIKHLYKVYYPDVKIDDTCEIFQNLNRVSTDEVSIILV